ncbi:MAG: ROK family protein [Acidimicrobiia bacterium]|nr:ROK family protein [Acidimicrobiia bacterium]
MSRVTVGVDLGGTKLAVVRLSDGAIEARERLANTAFSDGLVACAIAGVASAWTDEVEAIGVGVAGLVRWPDGVFVWGPHVAGHDVSLRTELESHFGVPVVVDNDANVTLHAEAITGAAVDRDDAVLVTLGTGIGGAVLAGGAIQRGGSFAGEFGHIAVAADGEPCACGRSGCWETMASGPALARLALREAARDAQSTFARAMPSSGIPEAVLALAATGDTTSTRLVNEVGVALGHGLVILTTVLDPQVIVVGGGFGSAAGDLLLDPAREALAAGLHGQPHRSAPPIVTAHHGSDGGAIGAALVARGAVEEEPS